MRSFSGVVYPAQCDAMGHMNVQYYIAAFDQAMWHLVHALGYRQEWQASRNEGWADVKHEITFARELGPGSLFVIDSAVQAVGNTSLTTTHRLCAMSGELAAEDVIVSVYFDLAARKSMPIPAAIRSEALEHCAKEGSRPDR